MKSVFFFVSFFRNVLKTVETILIKKFGRNYDISVYKKAPISDEHRKNYIFQDINYFVKMSVIQLVCAFPNLCGRASSKTSEYQNQISHVVLVH